MVSIAVFECHLVDATKLHRSPNRVRVRVGREGTILVKYTCEIIKFVIIS